MLASLENQPLINFQGKWSHFCISLDFPANEAKFALNGKLIETIKNPKTTKMYGDQFGGKCILDENEDSKYIFTLGRYHFDDRRDLAKYAGINAWNRTLSDEEIASYSDCVNLPDPILQGNLLSNTTKWAYPPSSPIIREETFDMNSFLCTEERRVTMFPMPIPVDTKEAMIDNCRKFGSNVYLAGDVKKPEDLKRIQETLFYNKEFRTECGLFDLWRWKTWLPYSLRDNLEYRHDITDEILDFDNYTSPFYYGHAWSLERNRRPVVAYMGTMMPELGKLTSFAFAERCCAMCAIHSSHENTTIVKLRGACKFSRFDLDYYVSNTSDGSLIYNGNHRSVIYYNYSISSWQLSDLIDPSISATFKSSFKTLGMGSNTWQVANDRKCQHGEVSIFLSLTTCLDTQFTCGDGLCIELEERCNGVVDCKDKVDEVGCNIAEIDPSYNKLLAPPPRENRTKVEVQVDVTINSFNSFDLIDSSFELEFVLALKWFDSRLVFNNLREMKSSNVMGPDEKSAIWFPSIVLENTKQKHEFIIDAKSVISIERNGTGKLADSTVTENKMLFNGNENPIHYRRLDNIKLNCIYELSWYPFDKQNCFIVIGQSDISSNYVEQVLGNFSYVGPKDLTKYFVKRTEMRRIVKDGSKSIQVRVVIGRRLLSIFLTTVFPTVLLNLIGHTANYFKEFFFEVSGEGCIFK